MRKKHIFKALSLIAAVCIAAGCNGSEIAKTTTTIAKQTTIASTTTKPLKEEINSTGNSEQPFFRKEFEITDWTMDELVSDFTLCGNKICIPCSVKQLEDNYNGTYINNALIYDNKEIGYIYNTTQKSQSEDPMIRQIVLGGLSNVVLPKFSIKTISETSTKYEVEEVLGIPNVNSGDESWARYFFSNNESILFVYDNENSERIKMITIVYNDEV